LTVVLDVAERHSAARIGSRWQIGERGCPVAQGLQLPPEQHV